MNEYYDVKEKRSLAKRRKKPTVFLIFLVATLLILFIVLTKNIDKFSVTTENRDIYYMLCLGVIFFCVFLLFALILDLSKPSNILQYDLKNIYIVKKHNKIIEIPIAELKRVRARERSRKKEKKPYGTITLITNKRKRYRIKSVYNVKEVKKEIFVLIEKLQIYYEGMREASRKNYEYQTNQAKHF